MAQTVTIIRDFPLANSTVVEWERGKTKEWIVARGIHIEERPMKGRLMTGELVTCYWDSGTYCTTKEGAMRIAIEREKEALEYLAEIYEEPEENWEDDVGGNMPCDNTGYCSGTSCPQYFKCH